MTDGQEPARCDFCRHEVVLDPVTADYDGDTYQFCTAACRDRLLEGEYVSAEYHGARRMRTGVAGIDAQLPEGVPRNSFVLVSGMAGSRLEAVVAEFAWRALRRDEPVVAVTLTEPPVSLVQEFLALGWNVLPYLEAGQLRIVDAFTYRRDDRERMLDRMTRWNRHLWELAKPATRGVRDASDLSALRHGIDDALDAVETGDTGLVTVDSLTELGTLVQPVQAYDFVKDLRADVCKGQYVPVVAGATFGGDDEFPHDLDYVVDGIVNLELAGDIVEDAIVKRARVRKLRGVRSVSRWTAYEYRPGRGMVPYDPRAQQAEEAADDASDAEAGSAPEPADGDEGVEAPDGDGGGEAAQTGDEDGTDTGPAG